MAANSGRPPIQEEIPGEELSQAEEELPPVEEELPPAESEPEIPYVEDGPAPIIPIPESEELPDYNLPPQEISLDGMFDEGPLPEEVPLEPLGATVLPDTPIALRVELDRYTFTQGEQLTLTLGALASTDAVANGAVITLTLPPELQIVGDAESTKVWAYDYEALSSGVYHTFIVEANPSTTALPAVVEIWLEATAEGYAPQQTRWVVGITGTPVLDEQARQTHSLQSANGSVLDVPGLALLIPSSAAPSGIEVEYTPIYTGSVSEGDVVTESDIITTASVVGTQLHLPLLTSDNQANVQVADTGESADLENEGEQFPVDEVAWKLPSIPTIENDGLTIYRQWTVAANVMAAASTTATDNQVSEHPTFATPVMMVIDVADLVAQGLPMGVLGLWTRPDESQPWVLVNSAKYDEKRQVWVAWLWHFSDFSLAIRLSSSYELLPSVNAFSSDRHTGAATINYPIRTPSGLGGLNPNLSLNYSSIVVDDIYMRLGHNGGMRRVQANMAGYGWNLGGVSYITKSRDNAYYTYYTLVLNGKSYDLHPNQFKPGQYDTDPISFAIITSDLNTTTSVWKIKTTDGMYYEFGGAIPNLNWQSSEATRPLYVEMRSSKTSASLREFEVVTWYLRRVEDTYGNTMEYHYDVQRRGLITHDTGEGGCTPQQYNGQPIGNSGYSGSWYNPVTRLSKITWGSNNGKYNNGVAQEPTLRVLFTYDNRNDFDNLYGSGDEDDHFIIFDGCQPRTTRQRLEEITVQSRQYNSTTVWQTIRRYNLDSTYAPVGSQTATGPTEYLRHMLLSKIHEYGAGTALLNTHTFTYWKDNDSNGDTVNSIWLETADNGYGGKTVYKWAWNRPRCSADHGVDTCGPDDRRHLVIRTRVQDGQGNYYFTDYDYSQPIMVLRSGRLLNFGSKFALSKIYNPTTYPYNPSSEALYEEYFFYQLVNDIFKDPDTRHGILREKRVYNISDSATRSLIARDIYTWTSFVRTSATAFGEHNRFDGRAAWLRLEKQDEWASNVGHLKTFSYTTDFQGGSQFGNVTRVEEYTSGYDQRTLSQWETLVSNNTLNLVRKIETEYFPNTGWPATPTAPYIVSLPARVIVKDGLGVCKSETRTIYTSPTANIQNREGAYNAAPITAYPIKDEKVISGCPHPATIDRETSTLLVTTYGRDAYGNATTQSSHNGVGNLITIVTEFDSFYKMFPIARWNYATPTIKARAAYYGVTSATLESGRAYWGAMSETCAVNGICSRFGYDNFGRLLRQWDYQVYGSGWPSDANANTLWGYRKPGELDATQKTYIVSEWHAPRCQGNFVRKHYDGLGQLVIEQKSYQDYAVNADGCNTGLTAAQGREIVTFFKYNAFGKQVEVTVPKLYTYPYPYYAPIADWSVKSTTYYDPLGRVRHSYTPNNEQTTYIYQGRATGVVGYGRNGDPNKMIHWSSVNEFGSLRSIRDASWNAGINNWSHDAEEYIVTDVTGNVTQIQHRGINSGGSIANNYVYDLAGRKTSSTDVDMGNWTYEYNRHGLLTKQKDGRGQYTCLYYDNDARLIGKHYNGTGATCPATLASNDHEVYTYGTSGTATGQLTQISLRDTVGGTETYKKVISYNSLGQVASETVSYPALSSTQYVVSYAYDFPAGRLLYTYYPTNFTPDNERITYAYNGMGLVKYVVSNVTGAVADQIGYDELGRMTSMRRPYSGGGFIYQTHNYHPWVSGTSSDSNSRLKEIRVGTAANGTQRLLLNYTYDTFGNIKQMGENYNSAGSANHTFAYDPYNMLTQSSYSGGVVKNYVNNPNGRPTAYEGQTNNYNNIQPFAVDSITAGSNTLLYDRDANGNAVKREYMNGSTKVTQTLAWNNANQLRSVSAPTAETYWYDADGIRTRKSRAGVNTLYPFPFFEIEGSTVTRYYMLNGQAIAFAQRIGSTDSVTQLYQDQVGSVVMTTVNGAVTQQRQYYPYGNKRGGNDFAFEPNYTGQRLDDTGLLYYNARYYDPKLGQFISPDTIIPDPSDYLSYNRYLYTRGNPLKYNDPSGHCAEAALSPIPCIRAFEFLQRVAAQWGPQLSQIGQQWVDKAPGFYDWFFSSSNNTAGLPNNMPQGGNTAGPGGLDPNDFNGIRNSFQKAFGNTPGAQSVLNDLSMGGNRATGASWQARYALQHLDPADVVAFEQRQGGGIVDIVTTQGSRVSFIEAKVITNWHALEKSGFSPNVAKNWLEQVYKQNPQAVYTKIVVETNASLPQSFIQFFEQEGIIIESFMR